MRCQNGKIIRFLQVHGPWSMVNQRLRWRALRQYNARMKTMTATQARQRLGTVLARVLQGEDIGIVHSGSGRIIALRPVEVYSEDYALLEYGVAPEAMRKVERNLLKKAKREKAKVWAGTPESLRH